VLHHLTYYTAVNGEVEDVRGLETPADLAALCRECHKRRHIDANGDWWNDPEEMADHWRYYNREMDRE
jgi:hypothetical protein